MKKTSSLVVCQLGPCHDRMFLEDRLHLIGNLLFFILSTSSFSRSDNSPWSGRQPRDKSMYNRRQCEGLLRHEKCVSRYSTRDHSGYGFSQWETTLQCNVVSHCLNPYPEWSLFNGRYSDLGICWCHSMETLFVLPALCAGRPPYTSQPSRKAVYDVLIFPLLLNWSICWAKGQIFGDLWPRAHLTSLWCSHFTFNTMHLRETLSKW